MVKDEFGLTIVKKEMSKIQIDNEVVKMFNNIWKEYIDTDEVEYIDLHNIEVPKLKINNQECFTFDNKED